VDDLDCISEQNTVWDFLRFGISLPRWIWVRKTWHCIQ